MIGDQLLHQIKQATDQVILDVRPWVYGHISSYDRTTHRVRLVIPSWRGEESVPQYSPWLPLGTLYAMGSIGIQWAPVGGATLENPTAGEQCVILLNNRGVGFAAVPCMFWNQTTPPPGSAGINPGELLIQDQNQSQIYVQSNGNITVTAKNNVLVNCQTAIVTAQQAVEVIAPAIKLCKSITDTLMTFCTSVFYNWAVSHVHGNVSNGSELTSPPTTSPPNLSLTSVVTGE